MSDSSNAERILPAVTCWEGVSAVPHRFGGTEFQLGTREIGHVHGNRLVDIPFPKKVVDDVLAVGETEPHHLLPDTGWVSLSLRRAEDADKAIALLKRSSELALAQGQRRSSTRSEGEQEAT